MSCDQRMASSVFGYKSWVLVLKIHVEIPACTFCCSWGGGAWIRFLWNRLRLLMTHWKHKLVTLSGWLFTPRQADKREFQLHRDQICHRTSQCQVLAVSASCVFIVRGADRRSVQGGGLEGKLRLMASICCFRRFLYALASTRAARLHRNRVVVQSMRTQEMGFIYGTPQRLRRSSPFSDRTLCELSPDKLILIIWCNTERSWTSATETSAFHPSSSLELQQTH